MAKTVSISEASIIAMLKGSPKNVLLEIFSKILIQSDSPPLIDEEETSYQQALKEHEEGETISWQERYLSTRGNDENKL